MMQPPAHPNSPSPSDSEKEESWTARNYDIEDTAASFSIRYAWMAVVVIVCIFLGTSLAFVYSATTASQGSRMVIAQSRWVIIGISALLFFRGVSIDWLYRISLWILIATALCLGYLAIANYRAKSGGLPFAPPVKGAVRWIRIAGYQLQPSECAKFVLALYISSYYNSVAYASVRRLCRGVLLPMVPVGLTLGLMLLGGDLSSTMLTSGMVLSMMCMGGIKFRHLFLVILGGMVLFTMMVCSSPERISRIMSWMHPDDTAKDGSYQVLLSQTAMSSGGLSGQGYNQGVIKGWLPESHTDFIVAVIGEETGLCGIYALLLLYLALCTCIALIAHASYHIADSLLGLGISFLIAAQAFINIGVVSNIGPTTGVTAPFLSYGGTSMVVMLSFIGLVLNIARRNHQDVMADIGKQRPTLPSRQGIAR